MIYLTYQNLEPLSYLSLFWIYPPLYTSQLIAMLSQHQRLVYKHILGHNSDHVLTRSIHGDLKENPQDDLVANAFLLLNQLKQEPLPGSKQLQSFPQLITGKDTRF